MTLTAYFLPLKCSQAQINSLPRFRNLAITYYLNVLSQVSDTIKILLVTLTKSLFFSCADAQW